MAEDRFERFKQLAKEEFGISVVKVDWNKEEVWNAIHELSDIRAGYNLLDNKEWPKYYACSLAIKALKAVIKE